MWLRMRKMCDVRCPASFRRRRRSICRASAGFTLIELIIVMAVTAIVMSVLTGALTFAMRASNDSSLASDAQVAAVQVEQKIELATRYADKIVIYTDNSAVDTAAVNRWFYTSGGKPYNGVFKNAAKTENLFTLDGQSRLNVTVKFTPVASPGNSVKVAIAVCKKGTTTALYVLAASLLFDNVSNVIDDTSGNGGACLGYAV